MPSHSASHQASHIPPTALPRYIARGYSSKLETTCQGGHVCGNDFYCASDNKHCCKDQGQSYCEGAIYCFNPSSEYCCGNTVCSAGYRCAAGGNSCIFTASSSALASASVTMTSSVTSTDIIAQTATPSGVQFDPTGACFLNPAFPSYTTPGWFVEMPSSAQNSFVSANSQSTGACFHNSPTKSGLSTGAKVGIGFGVPTAVILLGLLAFLLKKNKCGGRRSGPLPGPPPMNRTRPVLVVGAPR